MKKILTLFAALVLLAVGATAQKLSYSAVVRNSANELVANKTLTVSVSIANSATGNPVYSETQSATTNQNGLLTLTIGEGASHTGSLNDVTWATAYITTTYTIDNTPVTNTVAVNAVPYALYAESAGNSTQVNADWEATSGAAEILHKPMIPTVNNGTLTIKQGDVTLGTFTANQSGTTEVTIPTSTYTLTAGDIINVISNMTADEKAQLCQALNCSGTTPPTPMPDCPNIIEGATGTVLSVTSDGAEVMAYTSDYVDDNASVTDYGFRIVTVTTDNTETETEFLTILHSTHADFVYAEIDNENELPYIGAWVRMSDLPDLTGKSLDELAAVGTHYRVYPVIFCNGDDIVGSPADYTIQGGGDEPTPTTFTCGTDNLVVGNNTYQTVQIGTQCWTKTNMREAVGTNGTNLTSNNYSTTEPFYYVNTDVNDSIYGYYYNWEAAKLACPEGWHLPDSTEWTTMMVYVSSYMEGGEYKYRCGGDSANINQALATEGDYWNSEFRDPDYPCLPPYDLSKNNKTGFSAVPAGIWSHWSGFEFVGGSATFWSYPGSGSDRVGEYSLHATYANMDQYSHESLSAFCSRGQSVRCLKDDANSGGGEPTNSCPSVNLPSTTFELMKDDIDNIYYTEFNYTPGSGNETVTATYQTTSNGTFTCPNCLDVQAPEEDNPGIISVFVPDQNLSPAQQLVVTITIASDACDNDLVLTGTYEETQQIDPIPTTFTCGTDNLVVGNNSYPTVQIGTQCWTKTNMREVVGTLIPASQSSTTTAPYDTVNAYSYERPNVDLATSGYYYNWKAAKQVCPEGWHLPDSLEWNALIQYVDTCKDGQGNYKYRCDGTQGHIAKALALTSGWNPMNDATYPCVVGYNQDNNDATQFSAYPAGYRASQSFQNGGASAEFWSSTVSATANGSAVTLQLLSPSELVYVRKQYKAGAYPVRCLKDN